MDSLKWCGRQHMLHYEILQLFIQFIHDDEIDAIRESFYWLDEGISGSVDINEFKRAYYHLRNDANDHYN